MEPYVLPVPIREFLKGFEGVAATVNRNYFGIDDE